VPIAPTDTTPLSDENAADPTRPSPQRKKAQGPKPNGALRVDVARRSPKDSDPGSEKKPQRQTKAEAQTDRTPDSPLDRSAPRVPKPGVKAAPKPVWVPEPTGSPKPAAPLDRETESPPRIPNWERAFASTSRSDARWEGPDGTTPSDIPVHAPPHTRRQRLPRNRAFVTVAVVLCLLVAIVAGATIVSAFNNPTAPTANPGAAPKSEVPSPAVARVQAATDTAETATTTARSTLNTVPGIPTLTNVAAIINPYVESLQHYQTTLTNTAVPAPAKATVASVRSLVRQDARYLFTINVLPSLGLGAYLAEFGKRSTQLQLAFREIRGALSAATG
jgi:hypothetical protein